MPNVKIDEHWVLAVALLAVCACGGFALRQAFLRGQWQERVDDLNTQVATTRAQVSAYQEDSTLWARERGVLVAANEALSRDSARLAQRAEALADSNAAAIAAWHAAEARVDTSALSQRVKELLAAVKHVATTGQAALAACNTALTTAQGQRNNCEARRALSASAVLRLELLRTALTAGRDSALALLRPPPWFSLGFDVGIGGGCMMAMNTGAVSCGPSVHVTVVRLHVKLF